MKKLMFFLCALAICGGAGAEQWTLQALIDTAMVKSALLQDYAYQINSQTVEQERLRAVYMRSQVEVYRRVVVRARGVARRGQDGFSLERAE